MYNVYIYHTCDDGCVCMNNLSTSEGMGECGGRIFVCIIRIYIESVQHLCIYNVYMYDKFGPCQLSCLNSLVAEHSV